MGRVLLILLSATLWSFPPTVGNAAENPVTLTPDLKAEIAQLEVLRGAGVDPADLESKAVMVSFFASWCVPCRKGFIEQRKLLEALGPDRIKIIAVNWLEDIGHYPAESMRLTRLLDRVAPRIAVVEGTEAISHAFGDVRAIPSVFVFNAAGREIYRFVYSRRNISSNADYKEIAGLIDTNS